MECYFSSHDWGTWDNETKTATDTYYISTLDSTGSITDELISHKFYSTNPDGYLGYSNYNYFLWTDDSGDKWLVQNSHKNLQLNPIYDNNTNKIVNISSSNNYSLVSDSFTSINQADVTTSYFENNSIEDKYNGSTFN